MFKLFKFPFPETAEANQNRPEAVELGNDFVIFRDAIINLIVSYQKPQVIDTDNLGEALERLGIPSAQVEKMTPTEREELDRFEAEKKG
ncbi:MAG: hypothetical protein AAGF87_08730 [Bacteroidota bacterium]